MASKNDQLIIGLYANEDEARAAANAIGEWDTRDHDVRLGAIAVIVYDAKKDKIQFIEEKGQRSTKSGAAWGTVIGTAIGVLGGALLPGMIAAAAAGAALGALTYKRLGMSDEQQKKLVDALKAGGAGLGIMVDDFEVDVVVDKMVEAGGDVSHYKLEKEAAAAMAEAATAQATYDAQEGVDEATEDAAISVTEESITDGTSGIADEATEDAAISVTEESITDGTSGIADEATEDAVVETTGPDLDSESYSQRYVNVDFASKINPLVPLDRYLPLEPDHSYYFFLEIGDKPGGIDEKPVVLPDLPKDAELDVFVFGYPDGIQVQSGTDNGRLKLHSDGTISVTVPVEEPSALINSPLLQKRLYFSVVTPTEPGNYQLRCLVYYEQALVQARIISALVGTGANIKKKPTIRSRIDYTLSHSLDPSKLTHMSKTRLSLFMNDNNDGTHTIAVKGSNLPPRSVHLGEGNVKDRIMVIRGSMREAAWGDPGSFNRTKIKKYRYKIMPNLNTLQEDLIRLAISGWQLYEFIALNLGDAYAEELNQLLRETSELQFSAVENVTSIVPVAAIYDHPLDRSYDSDLKNYALCDVFKNSFIRGTPLDDTDCFRGNCPHRNDDRTVCPSGFWGYRHQLGLPVSVGRTPSEVAVVIPSTVPIRASVAVSTAKDLTRRVDHQASLSQISSSEIEVNWDYYDTHEKAIEMLRQTDAQIIYFYCHGGFDQKSNSPYLSLGSKNGPKFYPDILKAKEIQWDMPPLVFINGCYTTALDPEKAMNFVDRFIQYSRAAGVIGTEITIFESTAVMFAQEFFKRFLILRQTAGEAIRGARLNLLQAGNPFGLVYIPFVLPGLHFDNI